MKKMHKLLITILPFLMSVNVQSQSAKDDDNQNDNGEEFGQEYDEKQAELEALAAKLREIIKARQANPFYNDKPVIIPGTQIVLPTKTEEEPTSIINILKKEEYTKTDIRILGGLLDIELEDINNRDSEPIINPGKESKSKK
tara:strand:- start:134553 stop:134978 length:426 start_codon:yes stop_codon:yes gene_type:complete